MQIALSETPAPREYATKNCKFLQVFQKNPPTLTYSTLAVSIPLYWTGDIFSSVESWRFFARTFPRASLSIPLSAFSWGNSSPFHFLFLTLAIPLSLCHSLSLSLSLSVTLSLSISLSLSLSLSLAIYLSPSISPYLSLFTFSFLLCLLFREIMTEFPNVYSQKPFTLSTNPSLSRLEQMQRYMSGFLGQIRIRKQKADILYV